MTEFLFSIQDALSKFRAGAVMAYPTEGVFGLGCDPSNAHAVQRIIEIKQRDADKGVILIASEFSQLTPFLDLPADLDLAPMLATWPGPVTWILPANLSQNPLLRGQFSTQAVRVTAHPIVRALCDQLGHPLVSTSANLSGQPPLMNHDDLTRVLGRTIDGIVEGELGSLAGPTEIRNGLTGEIIRKGV